MQPVHTFWSFSTVSAGTVGRLMSASARKRRGSRVGSVAIGQTSVIQTPKLGARIMRYELADYEWAAIKPMLPNKPRGVPRVNDRRILNGIFWVLRSGAPWRDLPDHFGPYTTCYNRFVRWRRAGVWGRIIDALAAAHDRCPDDRHLHCARASAWSLHYTKPAPIDGEVARWFD